MAHLIENNTASRPLFHRITELGNSIAARFARYQTYRTTLAELNMLSDRDLDDLGIRRLDVHAVAAQAAYGK